MSKSSVLFLRNVPQDVMKDFKKRCIDLDAPMNAVATAIIATFNRFELQLARDLFAYIDQHPEPRRRDVAATILGEAFTKSLREVIKAGKPR